MGRLIQQQGVEAADQPAGENDLLLIAARECPRRQGGIGRADIKAADQFNNRGIGGGSVEAAQPRGHGGQMRQHDIVAHREVGDQRAATLAGHIANAGGDGGGRALRAAARPAKAPAQQGPGAGAKQPGQSRHLTSPGGHPPARRGQDQPLGPGGADGGFLLRIQGAPGHVTGEIGLGEAATGMACHLQPIAQHAHPVTQRAHLIEAMRDEHHRQPLAPHALQQGKEPVHLGAFERGGGLVENKDARLPFGQFAGQHHGLALGKAQRVHPPPGVNGQAQPGQSGLGALLQRRLPHATGTAGPAAEQQIIRHTHRRHDLQLLRHKRDAGGARRIGPARRKGTPGQGHSPRIGTINAGDNFQQAGFAGAILAHQPMHLSSHQAQRNAAQGQGIAEALMQVSSNEGRLHRQMVARAQRPVNIEPVSVSRQAAPMDTSPPMSLPMCRPNMPAVPAITCLS